MRIVGDHLHEHAKTITSDSEAGLFARSAVNRYYYSCFLTARELYKVIVPTKGVPAHKDLPTCIENAMCDKIVDALEAARRRGTIDASEQMRLRSRAHGLTSELSSILQKGYAVRCKADYDPEIAVLRINGAFSIASIKIAEAASWPRRAELLVKSIAMEWKNLGN